MGLSFSVAEKEAFYVAVPANRKEALKIVNIFKPLYEDEKILKIGRTLIRLRSSTQIWRNVKGQVVRHDDCTLPYPTRASAQYGLHGGNAFEL